MYTRTKIRKILIFRHNASVAITGQSDLKMEERPTLSP